MSDDINSMFGRPQGAPDTPEFWRMSSIVLKYDARMQAATNDQEREAVWNEIVTDSKIDGDSLAYMAFQRSMRALGISTVGEVRESMGTLTRLTSLYMEAFLFGIQYEREGATDGTALVEAKAALEAWEASVDDVAADELSNETLNLAEAMRTIIKKEG